MAAAAVAGDPSARKLHRATAMAAASLAASLFIFLALLVGLAAARSAKDEGGAPDGHDASSISARLRGIRSLLESHPGMTLKMLVRVAVATVLQVNLDAFLKLVVTPLLAATVVGAVAAPLTFFVGQAVQPVINSICFYGFDDPFLLATLEAAGGKERLAALSKTGEWATMGFFHQFFVRWCIKSMAGFVVGFAGIFAAIPVVGPVLTALLSGWAVAWDMVYIPLGGMGRVGVLHQSWSVVCHFWSYHWFGFWAVLMEEIPLAGPACHVYNVYSAAFFLERVYLNGTAPPAASGLGSEL